MSVPSWTDHHADLLAEAAPTIRPATEAELTRSYERVAPLTVAADRPRRARVAVAAVVAGTLIGAAGAAAADRFTARTGQGPSDAEDLRLGGPGEKLDLSAPDLGDVLAEESTDIPFASDAARRLSLRIQVQHNAVAPGSEPEFASTGAFRGWIAQDAVCSWVNQWARATRTGDGAGRAEAISMIQGAPRWDAVVQLDPEPYSRWQTREVTDGERTWTERYLDTSHFYYLGELGETVQGTDPAAVAAVLVGNGAGCDEPLVPDLPDAYPPNVIK